MEEDPLWHRISPSDGDLTEMPELSAFVSSLKFCDAVVQVGHPKISDHLVGLIYMGFLVPVMGPALMQVRGQKNASCFVSGHSLF